ncbi:MAG: hypothetical protein HRT35_18390 [Algicola sp.]|nr:hypothetical protein [Algicola sp.]
MKNEIPVISLFVQALTLPVKHWLALLKVSSPFILCGLFAISVYNISPSMFISKSILISPIAIVLGLASLITLIMAIVGCHRIFLLGPTETEQTRPFRWTGNEFRYALWWLAMTVLFAGFGMLYVFIFTSATSLVTPLISEYQFISSIIMALLMLPLYIVFVRVSVVLPAAAIGKANIGFGWAWNYSWNNSWRLIVLLGILPFTMNLISDQLPYVDSLWFNLLKGAIWLITGVISIAALSLSFHALSELEAQREVQQNAIDTEEPAQDPA